MSLSRGRPRFRSLCGLAAYMPAVASNCGECRPIGDHELTRIGSAVVGGDPVHARRARRPHVWAGILVHLTCPRSRLGHVRCLSQLYPGSDLPGVPGHRGDTGANCELVACPSESPTAVVQNSAQRRFCSPEGHRSPFGSSSLGSNRWGTASDHPLATWVGPCVRAPDLVALRSHLCHRVRCHTRNCPVTDLIGRSRSAFSVLGTSLNSRACPRGRGLAWRLTVESGRSPGPSWGTSHLSQFHESSTGSVTRPIRGWIEGKCSWSVRALRHMTSSCRS